MENKDLNFIRVVVKKRARSIHTSNIMEENTRDAACGRIKGYGSS